MVFKAEGIDRYGNEIDRHNLWEMVGARFKRALYPGTSDTGTYSFTCPGFAVPVVEQVNSQAQQVAFDAPDDSHKLTVKAVLNYQKADAAFLDRLFGEQANIRTTITEISSDTLVMLVDR